jgi:hypothetical protein
MAVSGLRRHNFFQEGDKLLAGVSRCGLTDDLAGLRIESRVEGECSVPEIFKAMLFSSPWRSRQAAVQPIQCLDDVP